MSKQKHKILKSQKNVLELKVHENKLQAVLKTKYVGVQIDCSLDWKEQVKAVYTKVSKALGFLKHANIFLPRDTLEILY